jgi:hypothetical protein
VYFQETACFRDDVNLGSFIKGGLSARAIGSLMNYIVKGIAIGVGGPAAWVIIVGEMISGTSPNLYEEKDGPTLLEMINGLSTLLTARKILKDIAPTLYDRLFWAFIKDVAREMPKVADAETFFIFLAENIGYLVKNGFKGTLKFWKVLLVMAFKVITNVLKLAPKAAGATAHADMESAKEFITFLINLGVEISPAEREKIVQELKKRGPEIIKVLRDLENDMRVFGSAK